VREERKETPLYTLDTPDIPSEVCIIDSEQTPVANLEWIFGVPSSCLGYGWRKQSVYTVNPILEPRSCDIPDSGRYEDPNAFFFRAHEGRHGYFTLVLYLVILHRFEETPQPHGVNKCASVALQHAPCPQRSATVPPNILFI
jgi:hypothetical protein